MVTRMTLQVCHLIVPVVPPVEPAGVVTRKDECMLFCVLYINFGLSPRARIRPLGRRSQHCGAAGAPQPAARSAAGAHRQPVSGRSDHLHHLQPRSRGFLTPRSHRGSLGLCCGPAQREASR